MIVFVSGLFFWNWTNNDWLVYYWLQVPSSTLLPSRPEEITHSAAEAPNHFHFHGPNSLRLLCPVKIMQSCCIAELSVSKNCVWRDLHACHKRFHLFLRIPCVSWKIGFREYCWTFHSLTLDFSLFLLHSARYWHWHWHSSLGLTLRPTSPFNGESTRLTSPWDIESIHFHFESFTKTWTILKYTHIFSDETQSTTCTKFFFCMTCDTSMLYIYFYGKTFMFMLDDRSLNALYKQMFFVLRLEHCHATSHSWHT